LDEDVEENGLSDLLLNKKTGEIDFHPNQVAPASLLDEEEEVAGGKSDGTPGGIDLNPTNLDLYIKRDGNGVPFPVWEQSIGNIRIDGFVPVIINVAPANIPLLLGLVDEDFPDSSFPSDNNQNAMPAIKPKEEVLLNNNSRGDLDIS